MKKTMLWCALAALSLTIAAAAQDMMKDTTKHEMSGRVEKAIADLEQKWTDAQKAGDAEPVAPLLAEKYINTGSDGKVIGKSETLAHMQGAKWQVNKIDDMKVAVFGNTAIATGEWTGKGTEQDGKAVDAHERWTDTWVKMPSGHWQCVASHGSPIKM